MCSYIRNAAIILLVTCCLNCKSQQINKISQIEIATGYCHGECAYTASKINKSLDVEFYGGGNADIQGYFRGEISEQMWDSITQTLDKIDFTKLNNYYGGTVDDQSIELIIVYNGDRKVIHAQSDSLPIDLKKAIYRITHVYRDANLRPTKDIIKFSTTIQYAPKPNGNPKFPPVKQ